MGRLRVLFWRIYYTIANPFRRLYWRIAQPKARAVKCVIKHRDAFLLVRLAYAHKHWTVPGGAVNKKESYEDAAWRELGEETSVQPSRLVLFGEYENRRQYKQETIQCFFGETDSNFTKVDPLEIAETGWFRRDELPADRSDRVDKIIGIYDAWTKV